MHGVRILISLTLFLKEKRKMKEQLINMKRRHINVGKETSRLYNTRRP